MKAMIAILALSLTASVSAFAKEKTVEVGGAAMYPSKDIIDNAVNSKDHTTLVAAVKAAGLVETLKGKGPFTVFAPTNAAFDKLPKTLRKALNETAFKWSAKQLEDVRRSRGITHHNVVKFLSEQDKHTIELTAREVWGADYIRTVYPQKLVW